MDPRALLADLGEEVTEPRPRPHDEGLVARGRGEVLLAPELAPQEPRVLR